MPPEIVALFENWPAGVLLVFLASPFFVLIGVIINALVKRFGDTNLYKISQANVDISETEAETHQFQAIVDGFTRSLEAVERRADAAQKKADEVKQEADQLGERVKTLEDERYDAINHILLLESLIPHPPGPPTRPVWMQKFYRL